MRNIHLKPTTEPSSIFFNKNRELQFTYISFNDKGSNQNIHITNDEEIKDHDWYVYIKDGSLRRYKKEFNPSAASASYNKKIILTTDPELIKDGVQAIPDEFLEWFVKNLSCEFVETKHIIKEYVDEQDAYGYDVDYYKIIIPKEPKQETLEEVCNKINFINPRERVAYYNGLKNGAKWKQERSYSEEEVDILISLLKQTTEYEVLQSFRDKVEQFKNK